MAGALRKTMVYLGLAEEDDRYDDGYDLDEEDRRPARTSTPGAVTAAVAAATSPRRSTAPPSPRCRTPQPPVARVVRERGRSAEPDHDHPPAHLQRGQEDRRGFRDGMPVIMNLSDMDDDDAKRLVDFAAGLVFGLHGDDRARHLQGVPAVAGPRRGLDRGVRRPAAAPTARVLQPELTAGRGRLLGAVHSGPIGPPQSRR